MGTQGRIWTPETPACRRETGKLFLWLGTPLLVTFGERQGREQASGALLPGRLRSEQQSATPKPNPAELLGVYCLRTNQRSGVFSEIWEETVDSGT